MSKRTSAEQAIEFVVPVRSAASTAGRGGRGASAGPTAPAAAPGVGGPSLIVPGATMVERVEVARMRSGSEERHIWAVPGQHAVVLRIAANAEDRRSRPAEGDDGPPAELDLALHPETAKELLLAQGGPSRRRGAARGASAAEAIEVDPELGWGSEEESAASRGLVGQWVAKAIIKSVEKLDLPVTTRKVGEWSARWVADRFDQRVAAGLHAIPADWTSDAPLRLPIRGTIRRPAKGEPILVLLHGTFSSTWGSFGKLWKVSSVGYTDRHQDRVTAPLGTKLANQYPDRLYGLEHPTASVSPIANAVELARHLPDDTQLDLLTHSRGGLIAEVLARACAGAKAPKGIEDLEEDQTHLAELDGLLRQRRISIRRIVRVACPAHGTLLASGRLDVLVSILRWLAPPGAATEILGEVLSEAVRTRLDPRQMPGLAAMVPGSPLLRWLRSGPAQGDLRVIAGDVEARSIWGWVKSLVADSFFLMENDLVVNTNSMYGGGRRDGDGRALYLYDEGGHVSHFRYFGNAETAPRIVQALDEKQLPGFAPIGELSWSGQHAQGTRAGALRGSRSEQAGTRPVVVVVPGLFGSRLKIGGETVWLDLPPAPALRRLAWTAGGTAVEADGLIGDVFDTLCEHLSATHHVEPFAYDWRAPLEQSATALGTLLDELLKRIRKSKQEQPVRILAHGSGGLVVRALQWLDERRWSDLQGQEGFRALLLGTPHEGWWLPFQLLSGAETLGGTLDPLEGAGEDRSIREILAGFPGLLQAQADLVSGAGREGSPPDGPSSLDLARVDTWRELAEAELAEARHLDPWHMTELMRRCLRWGVPDVKTLDAAGAFRRKLDAQRADGATTFRGFVQVVGTRIETPAGYDRETHRQVLDDDGDGCTTRASAALADVPTWLADVDHIGLVTDESIFGSLVNLLREGTTHQLVQVQGPDSRPRGQKRTAALRLGPPPTPAASRSEALGFDGARRRAATPRQPDHLRVTVVHADIRSVEHPLLIGHWRASTLTGSELVMNRAIGGTMGEALRLRRYPDMPGESEVFLNSRPGVGEGERKPEAVIVVGLGPEGSLRTGDLAMTVRQGVLAWSQRERERIAREARDPAESTAGLSRMTIASTLLGSGGVMMTAGACARQIVEGVRAANAILAEEGTWPRVSELKLIELYLDRAAEAWSAVRGMIESGVSGLELDGEVSESPDALLRPLDRAYRGTGYDFVSAMTGNEKTLGDSVSYAVDTRRARGEQTGQTVQLRLAKQLVAAAAEEDPQAKAIRSTLFRLLIPEEIESHLLGSTALLMELDEGTAGVPWELLDPQREGDGEPWAIRSRLIRRLRLKDFPRTVRDADRQHGVLIIGAPGSPKNYCLLPGAAQEAGAVFRILRDSGRLPGGPPHALLAAEDGRGGPSAIEVSNALMSGGPWRIIHIAGHGDPPDPRLPRRRRCRRCGGPPRRLRGVVLSDGVYFGPGEFRNLRVVPELVFVNCCWLGKTDEGRLLSPSRRPEFARSVAEGLIGMGVKCVIAAGWPVGDESARVFAETFYRRILDGDRFIDAVTEARRQCHSAGGGDDNTWAAYQAYGDPDWTLEGQAVDRDGTVIGLRDLDTICTSVGLVNALRTITLQAKLAQPAPQPGRGERARPGSRRAAPPPAEAAEADHGGTFEECIRKLARRAPRTWTRRGDVAEAFGDAWAQLGEGARVKALEWYERALSANDGRASFRMAQELAQLAGREAFGPWDRGSSKEGRPGPGWSDPAAPAAAERIGRWLGFLERLIAVKPTIERHNLAGSTAKRLMLLHERAGGPNESIAEAQSRMFAHYEEALRLAAGSADDALPQAFLMLSAAKLHAARRAGATPEFDDAAGRKVRALLVGSDRKRDFWTQVNLFELDLYQAMAENRLAKEREGLAGRLKDIRRVYRSPWGWDSVRHQAEFVLDEWVSKGNEKERQAAEAILNKIREAAGQAT